jgi:membrane-associated phospholipid phosphatase
LARRFLNYRGRLLPAGPVDAVIQYALFAAAYYAYRIVRGMVDGSIPDAFAHSRALIHAEQSLGLFFEAGLQDWATRTEWPLTVANWMYVNSHFVVTTTFLVWLYLARNHAYYFVRNMFVIAMSLALVGYVLYPAAPPRFFPEYGFADSVEAFVGQGAAQSASLLYNPYAAVPSMHVAFALMVAIPAVMLVRWRVLKVAWALYPTLVTFVVLATGNHFWLDAVLGVMVAALSAYAASAALARARPEAWAWRSAAAPAKAGI